MCWTPASRHLWERGDLGSRELIVLLYLMTHDTPGPDGLRQGRVALSQQTLARACGLQWRQILRILGNLERTGLLRREGRPGRGSIFWISPAAYPSSGNWGLPTEPTPVFHDTPVMTPLSKKTGGPLSPVTHVRKEELKEEGEAPVLSPPSGPKKGPQSGRGTPPVAPQPAPDKPKRKKPGANGMTREEVVEALNSISLSKFSEQYPQLNIPETFERFRVNTLDKINPKARVPNWQMWSNWNSAFHTWCRNDLKFHLDRQPPNKTESFADAYKRKYGVNQ